MTDQTTLAALLHEILPSHIEGQASYPPAPGDRTWIAWDWMTPDALAARLIVAGVTVRGESVLESSERLGIPAKDHGLPMDVVRPPAFADDYEPAGDRVTGEVGVREAVIHAARDVNGLWFPQDDNDTGTDLTFWGPEAGEALRDLRDAIDALDAREDDLPIRTVTTPDGQVYHAAGEAGLREAAINVRNQALPPSVGHDWYCVRPKDFDALRAALATEQQP